MAAAQTPHGDQECRQTCQFARQISSATTTLPSSPPMSRMVSPESDHDYDFLEEFQDGCTDFESTGLPDEVYKFVLPVDVARLVSFTKNCIPVFCLLAIASSSMSASIGSFMETCGSTGLCVSMGVVIAPVLAGVALLPRVYEHVMYSCSFEDSAELDNGSDWPEDDVKAD
mmetsp:Transcript_90108/g.158931  ORF Transcript_90108/g.158931 Transcript_90108/m.158931 type:complete len:171 (-) Transcript_90108:139-651(-)